ncbi:MAG: DUF1646 domain-containing protein [Endomicrobia bacterium]|nr:DUF1646 domain-containing protein [Endomicrobiia bacterium]
MQFILLSVLIILVLCLPLIWHKVEENLEPFLFICGVLAVFISSSWSKDLVKEAFTEPFHICLAVFIVGLAFKKFHFFIRNVVHVSVTKIGLRWTMFLIVLILGFTSSIITAIVAALILSEVAAELSLKRSERIKLVIYTCFAISIGSVLTPIGEPLGAIIISKLANSPHKADTVFMIKLLWPYVTSAILFLSFLAYRIVDHESNTAFEKQEAFHSIKDILLRTAKIYIFVSGLILLGDGLKPLAYKTIFHLPPQALYWVNLLSAVLDNATMAAIEVVPEMSRETLIYLTVSLILGGAMMIPGNIPNIIVSSKLGIKSRQWAKVAIPLGLVLMLVYFLILLFTV